MRGDRESKTLLAASDTLAVVRRAISKGCIRFLPPLNTPEDMPREALDAMACAIEVSVAAENLQAEPAAAPR